MSQHSCGGSSGSGGSRGALPPLVPARHPDRRRRPRRRALLPTRRWPRRGRGLPARRRRRQDHRRLPGLVRLPGDGAPINGWWHWSQDWGQPPSPTNTRIRAWPDMREYTARLPDGVRRTSATASRPRCSPPTTSRPSTPTSAGCSRTASTPRRCSASTRTAARARPATRWPAKVRSAAEAHRPQVLHHVRRHRLDEHAVGDQGRLDHQDVGAHRVARPTPGRTASRWSCIWGFGFNDDNHPLSAGRLPGRDQLVQGPGLLRDRRGADASGAPAPAAPGPASSTSTTRFDMISPWMVGRIGTPADSDRFYTERQRARPGRLRRPRHRLPALRAARRRVGAAARARRLHVAAVLQHGPGRRARASTSRCSTSSTRATRSPRPPRPPACVPAGSGLLALDEDGTACSSDYYLRLTGDGGRMLKGQLALTADPADPAGRRRHHPAAHDDGDQPAGAGQQPATSRADNAGALAADRQPAPRSGRGSSSTGSTPAAATIALRAQANGQSCAPTTPAPRR